MKNIIVAVLAFMFVITSAKAQFAFGVNTDFAMKSAYFGYQFDDFVPYVGLQYFTGSFVFDAKTKYLDYDYENDEYILTQDNYSGDLTVTVLMPFLGCKYFISQHNKLKSYVNLSISKPMIFGNMKDDGKDVTEFNNVLDDISLWGFSGGFGVEYFVDNNFSLGGEFGINAILTNFDETSKESDWGDGEEYNWENSYSTSLNLGLTYARVSLNYYFGD